MNLNDFEGREVCLYAGGDPTPFRGELTLIDSFGGNGGVARLTRKTAWGDKVHTYLDPTNVVAVSCVESESVSR